MKPFQRHELPAAWYLVGSLLLLAAAYQHPVLRWVAVICLLVSIALCAMECFQKIKSKK